MRKTTIIYAVLLLASCRSVERVSTRERQEAIAVNSASASGLSERESVWTETKVVETIVMESDSAGELVEKSKTIRRETTERMSNEKIVENTQKLDSAAFLSENDVIILQEKEKPLERRKTAFWRNSFFAVLMLAAIAVGVVFLWRKTLRKWI